MSQKYEKLKTLLKELFQLDQPDLDFGLYRIMHAKSTEVSQFLDRDLLPQVKDAFALYHTVDKVEIEKELAKVVAGIEAAGMDPEQSPKVAELRARLASEAVDVGQLESEVYDHLFSFFRRYYSEGDFLSKRVYKPGVYAIPYEGEEVKLHWANADQYYIKTSEYLRDYAFRLRPDDEAKPMRVHFHLVDAAEGEHGNVKAAAGKDRRFKLAETDALAIEDGELIVRFTYQPDPVGARRAAGRSELVPAADPRRGVGLRFLKREWELPHLEYRDLEGDDPNFLCVKESPDDSCYRILIDRSREEIVARLEELKAAIEKGDLKPWEFQGIKAVWFGLHLYQPLLYLESKVIEISPAPLNKGERLFVEDLKAFHDGHGEFFEGKELYLLRNLSKGKGVGFFEAGNFHPDFILWLLADGKQHVIFVDPKGIRNLGPSDPKIQFHETIKEIEQRLGDASVRLESFIVSNTPSATMRMLWNMEKAEMAHRHIVFQGEDKESYVQSMLEGVEA